MIRTIGARRVAFAHNSGSLVFVRGAIDRKNVWQLNPQTGTERQLTDLPASFVIGDFDVSPDGAESSSTAFRRPRALFSSSAPRSQTRIEVSGIPPGDRGLKFRVSAV
jgi:hypothetical protein